MALDIADSLKNYDLELVNTDRYRTFNLLKKSFEDNLNIGIKLNEIIRMGLSVEQIENVLIQYLSKFGVNLENFFVQVSKNGDVNFDIQFGEEVKNVFS